MGAKDAVKKIVPPTTAMVDKRFNRLLDENEALRAEVGRLANEVSALNRCCASMAEAMNDLRSAVAIQNISDRRTGEAPVREDELIVSIATYAPRLDSVVATLHSVARQTVKPDRVMLWLPRDGFPAGMRDLPADTLSAIDEAHVEVHWAPIDLGPHNKYFWTMRAYPNNIVVTLDDDALYDADLLESLIQAHATWPDAVVSMRTHMIETEDGGFKPYAQWTLEQAELVGQPSMRLLATGVGGVLYPPHAFDERAFDVKGIQRTCLYADDLWLKVMEVLAGTKVVCPEPSRAINYVEDSQGINLCDENLGRGGNDSALANIIAYVKDGESAFDIMSRLD